MSDRSTDAKVDPVKGYVHEDAFDSGYLKVDDLHTIYYEQYGKRDGKPALFLHGGPGGSISKDSVTSFFNPQVYRVVAFDQRGCGRSTPRSELRNNTTQHLVQDIETLRQHLGINQWFLVFGGSWGSLLSFVYAQTHPESVGSMILRGIFAARKWEFDWFYQAGGGATVYADRYEAFRDHIPREEQHDLVAAYHKRFHSADPEIKAAAARSWSAWELSTGTLHFDPAVQLALLDEENFADTFAGMETHYFVNGCFIEDGQILKKENIAKIAHIPITLVQGRYDMICPPQVAYEMHNALPLSTLHYVPDAGHAATEPGTKRRLIEACDEHLQY